MLSNPKPTLRTVEKRLRAELDRAYQTIALLRGQLADHNIHSINGPPKWAKYLSHQETALMQMLLDVYPRGLSTSYLEDNLPCLDHARQRKGDIVPVVVSKVRSSLGRGAIDTIRGQGYRCSAEFAEKYKHTLD